MFTTVISAGKCFGAGVGIRNGKRAHLKSTALRSAGVMNFFRRYGGRRNE